MKGQIESRTIILLIILIVSAILIILFLRSGFGTLESKTPDAGSFLFAKLREVFLNVK